MPKIHEISIGRLYHYYPTTVAVITVKAKEKSTAMAAAWHSALSYDPPLYGVLVSPKRFSHNLILEAKEFAVNFLPFEKAEIIAQVGRNSTKEADKFQEFSIELEKPLAISAPILKDAYAAYECHLVDHRDYGDHTLFVGEIVMVHRLEEAFSPEGVPDLSRVRPAMYLGANLYVAPSREEPVRLVGTVHKEY
ncbi:MAG: flavin reductase family protein [Chloroflexi bacterium]|nr:flavin reductase family protein [Chloroflexota bacterium]